MSLFVLYPEVFRIIVKLVALYLKIAFFLDSFCVFHYVELFVRDYNVAVSSGSFKKFAVECCIVEAGESIISYKLHKFGYDLPDLPCVFDFFIGYSCYFGYVITDRNLAVFRIHNPFRYRGYYYDVESGLYYLNSRYYDPQTGRFINADAPEILDGGNDHLLENNLFAYCFNDPVNRFDDSGNWSLPNWAKIAIGAAAIAVGVIATAATGGAAAPVLVASLKIAATSAAIGAVSGAGINAVSHRMATGSWKGAGKAAVRGAIDGACDGFMWGGITAGATFTTVAAKGAKIQNIGKLKPKNKSGKNKSGKGYRGVQYKNKRGSLKSFELHSPHKGGNHQKWHWQQNTWNPKEDAITGSSIHWTLFGRRF